MDWDEDERRWSVTTSRGDRLAARFVIIAGGILHKAKLPGIPGIEIFKGHSFHTAGGTMPIPAAAPPAA